MNSWIYAIFLVVIALFLTIDISNAQSEETTVNKETQTTPKSEIESTLFSLLSDIITNALTSSDGGSILGNIINTIMKFLHEKGIGVSTSNSTNPTP
ncbi:hypothetical protein C0J52_10294 [Blattella germanica]|nr:hypothetical protein C0J52_10294 [Blattella germanica]